MSSLSGCGFRDAEKDLPTSWFGKHYTISTSEFCYNKIGPFIVRIGNEIRALILYNNVISLHFSPHLCVILNVECISVWKGSPAVQFCEYSWRDACAEFITNMQWVAWQCIGPRPLQMLYAIPLATTCTPLHLHWAWWKWWEKACQLNPMRHGAWAQ